MNAIWTDLPHEILLLIIEQTDHTPTLSSWSCVCRQLWKVATQQLWHHVKFNCTHDCSDTHRYCGKIKMLTSHFRRAHSSPSPAADEDLQTNDCHSIIAPGEMVKHIEFGFSTLMSCSAASDVCIRSDRDGWSKNLAIAAGAAKSLHFYGFLGSSVFASDLCAFQRIEQLKLRAGNFCPRGAVPNNMVNSYHTSQEILDFGPLSELTFLRVLSIGEILIEEEAAIAKGTRRLPLILQLELEMQNNRRSNGELPLTRFFSALVSDDGDMKNSPVGFPATLRKLTLTNTHEHLPVDRLTEKIRTSFSSCVNLTHLKLDLLDADPCLEILLDLKFPALTHLSLNLCTGKAAANLSPSSVEVDLFCRVCNAYETSLKSVEIVNAWDVSFRGFFHSANLRGAKHDIGWTAQELRLTGLEVHGIDRHSTLQDLLFSALSNDSQSQRESFRWGTELSRVRIPKLHSCLPQNPHLDPDTVLFTNFKSLRLLAINEIVDSQAPSTEDRPFLISSTRRPEQHASWTHYSYDESTKADVLLEMASAMVRQFEPLSALRVLYLDSERYWIERNGPYTQKVWRLWDAMDDPMQRVQIDQEISHADWAFLSERKCGGTAVFLPSRKQA